MPLIAGSRLGPYEIVTPLGAGGMGEVYRARDPRMDRDVAIKILPRTFSENRDRLQRFELEARATGKLNHPNLLVVHDVGTDDGLPYLVSELLDGETLRERLALGPLNPRKVVEYGIEIANGVAAAHEKGIIHRDLKPENIFLTSDDRVKLLDFGLAKLFTEDEPSVESIAPTMAKKTDPGVVMGTPAYMSPEQVRGEAVDARTDVFSFGTVLLEMVSGKNPFHRGSSVETMGAILSSDPALPESVHPGLMRIIEHALDKHPARRFQSMKDVAFALEMLSGSSESSITSRAKPRPAKRAEKRPADIVLRRLTYRRGFIMTARFAPDGSVVYGAAWEDQPLELFSSYPGNPESRPIGLPNADILAISHQGELAVSLNRRFLVGWVTGGTLARMPLAGGAPREVCEEMQDADWAPDGKSFAIIRRRGDVFTIEYPIGNCLLESSNWISHVRLSPKADRIAFVDHPLWGDDAGRVAVIDLQGHRLVQSETVWSSTSGVCWTPKGDEVWIAAERAGMGRDLIAVTLSGKERVVLPAPGRLTLHDISPKGEILLSYDSGRREIMAGNRGQGHERNLSWFDWSFLCGLSSDGTRITFEEQGVAKRGVLPSIYIRSIDGAPAVYLGDGRARGGMSADARWIAADVGVPGHLEILPTGAGQSRLLKCDHVETKLWWYWFPDGKRLLLWGNEPGRGNRMFVVPLDGADPTPVGPEGTRWPIAIAPDGDRVTAIGPDGRVMIYRVSTDQAELLQGSIAGDQPISWSADGKAVYVYQRGRLSVAIERIDTETGERSAWQELRPNDPAGVMDIMPVEVSRDEKAYAYGYRRFLSELYLVTGLL